MARPQRVFWLFVFGGALVFAVVIFEVAHARYGLVDDYRAFTLLHMGAASGVLAHATVDWGAPDAWLYRPFPDAISYALATALREHPGMWHSVSIALRLASIAIVFLIARSLAPSLIATCAATAYFAVFPAIPELHLLRVEGWVTLLISIVLFGWVRLERQGKGPLLTTAIAFVLATASKEVLSPVLFALLALLGVHYWRRGPKARAAFLVMLLAGLYQAGRFALVFTDPYARGEARSHLVASLAKSAFWVAKVILLAPTSFALVSIVLAVWVVLGCLALREESLPYAIGIAALLLLSVGMAVVAPYPAIRYLSPAALFLVPILVAGASRLGRYSDTVATLMVVCFIVFGGAGLIAQSASLRACSSADWELLREEASALSSGRNVVVLEAADWERSFWMRAELVGVDPRWPFLTYVAQRYAREQPIVWPTPPEGGPVNLTGLVAPNSRGQFMTVARNARVEGNALIVPADPLRIPQDYVIARTIDFRRNDPLFWPLSVFRRAARFLNPKFHYPRDLGEVEFPGYSWPILRLR